MLFAAVVIPSSRDFFARGGFVFGGAAVSAAVLSVGVLAARFGCTALAGDFLMAGMGVGFIFLTANPCFVALTSLCRT
jgi:hypothetical protein